VYGDGSDMAQANTLRVCLVHPTLVLWPAYVCIPDDKTLLGALSAARLSICSTSYSVTVVPTMHARHNVILHDDTERFLAKDVQVVVMPP